MAQTVKNLPARWETQVQPLGQEDPLEEGMATHSSILAWRIPKDRGAWQARAPRDTTEQHTHTQDAPWFPASCRKEPRASHCVVCVQSFTACFLIFFPSSLLK